MSHTLRQPQNILVCLSSSPSNQRVIRAASKLFDSSHDTFIALYIGESEESLTSHPVLQKNMQLAKQLGAHIHFIQSKDVALAIAEYATSAHITDIFIGNSPPSRFLFAKKPISEKLTAILPNTDIHIIPDRIASSFTEQVRQNNDSFWNWKDFFIVFGIMSIATVLSIWFDLSRYSNSNIITIYILAVLIASVLTSHQIYGVFAAILYILLFNYLFIEPRFTLLVYDSEYLMTYFVTLIAAFITGTLAIRLKENATQSARNAYQATLLLETSNQLERATDKNEIIYITCTQLTVLLKRSIAFYPIQDNQIQSPLLFPYSNNDMKVFQQQGIQQALQWTKENRHHSGAFTSHYSKMQTYHLSIHTDSMCYGIIAIEMGQKHLSEFETTLLLAILNEFGLALEKERIEIEKQEVQIEKEKATFRANLLRSISHDLRSPLTTIYGNTETLLKNTDALSKDDQIHIFQDMQEDSSWLMTQMENILSMTKLENDTYVHFEVENVDDVIQESLKHIDAHAKDHTILYEPPVDSIFAKMDAKLIMQVLVNLVNNAIKYTPIGSHITLSIIEEEHAIWIEVKDDGPGIPDEDKQHIFELFYTTNKTLYTDSYRRMGIGLNLCQMILKAHNQPIEVLDNKPHGAIFRFRLEKENYDIYEE